MKRILIALLLFSQLAQAQTDNPNKYVFYRYEHGKRMHRVVADSASYVPVIDTTWTPYRAGALTMRPQDTLTGVLHVYSGATTGKKWYQIAGSAASIDSFTYATRRYVDSSTAVFGSRLYDTYNTHDTLTQSRAIDLNDAYGLTFTVDGTNDIATGINASGFTTKRSKHDFTANNGWIYGQLHDPAQVYKTRFQVIGLVNDSTHSAQLISTNGNTYNQKAALVSAAWWEGAKLQANVNWTTSGSTSGYKGIYVYSTAGDGTGQVKIDREVLSVGSATDSAYVRKSDGTTGLYPLSGGGGASYTPTITTQATSTTLSTAYETWVFTGSSAATFTLSGATAARYTVKNRGADTLTLSGSIYSGGAVASLSLPPGWAYTLQNDGTYWNVTGIFNPDAFTTGGDVALVTPDAPTDGVVDDLENTFAFTPSAGYTATDHEYQVNGSSYTDVLTNPISVGNDNIPIGALLVRVKAGTGNTASATLSNATAFTQDVTDPTVSFEATSATNIRATYSEPMSSVTTAGYTFNNGAAITPTAVTSVSSTVYDFTVSGLAAGQTITADYNSDAGNTLDKAELEMASFFTHAVTNSVPGSGLAAAYITAVEGAGGTLSAGAKTELQNFQDTINSIGAAKFKQILLYAGGTAGSAVIDFMGVQNGTLVGSPTVSGLGVALNGTSQYVNSGVAPSAHFTLNDIGITQKLKDNAANNHRSGVYVAATNDLIQITMNGDGANSYLLCGSIATTANAIDNPGAGYNVPWTVVRRSDSESKAYIGGGSGISAGYNNSTTGFSSLPAIPVFYGAANLDGTPQYYTANTLQFNAMHTGLSDVEIVNLQTAINSLMTALGR